MKITTTSLMLLAVYLASVAPSLAADQPNTGPVPDQGSQQQGQKTEQLEEVVVTGTHIRGVSPASPLIVLTATDIANSGLSATGDVLRNLPQSFAVASSRPSEQMALVRGRTSPISTILTAPTFVALAPVRRSC
jgi:hypothetical protein